VLQDLSGCTTPLARPAWTIGGFEFDRCPLLDLDGTTYTLVEMHRTVWRDVTGLERLHLPSKLVESMLVLDTWRRDDATD
jgi:hypothetical protein